jgi:AcrR family transcriptional regulator
VTEQLIDQAGLGAVTMEGVALAANVSKPVLYSHFEHRAALLLALLEQYWARVDAEVSNRAAPNASADEQLAAIVEGVFRAMAAGGRVMQLFWSDNSQEPLVEEASRKRRRATEASWAEAYRKRCALTKPEAECAAAMVRAAIAEATAHWFRTPDARRDECASICTMFVQGGLRAMMTDAGSTDAGHDGDARTSR